MQQALGEVIRQLRRQRSLTQTELGAERFSKSYVSAIEREAIKPSYEALRFFAEQLDQPYEYFLEMFQHMEQSEEISLSVEPAANENFSQEQEKLLGLLDMVLQRADIDVVSLSQELATLPGEAITTLPGSIRARYNFLQGLLLQQQGNFPVAVMTLEQALTLDSVTHQVTILDALGTTYYHMQKYEAALEYHLRALKSMQEMPAYPAGFDQLALQLHCGNDYRALSRHQEACEQYEQARAYLRPTHNMAIAAQLYLSLGYCTYASIYQSKEMREEVSERMYQRAISFLLQSRTLYQISGQLDGEIAARLTQAMILLDFSTWRYNLACKKSTESAMPFPINSANLLDEAEEQCQQVFAHVNNTISGTPSADQINAFYQALAYLIRVYTQRASLSYLGNYKDTGTREQVTAAYLCEQALSVLTDTTPSLTLLQDIMNIQNFRPLHQRPAIPTLPDLSSQQLVNTVYSLSQAEIYFAAGELAEQLGREANSLSYALACYTRADEFYQLALHTAQQTLPNEKHDSSYLTRIYQRCIDILTERLRVTPDAIEGTAKSLLGLLKEALLLCSR